MACLLWFGTSETFYLVENTISTSTLAALLVPEVIPTRNFQIWARAVLSMAQLSENAILLALMFIYRLREFNPGFKGTLGSEFNVLIIALMLANKGTLF